MKVTKKIGSLESLVGYIFNYYKDKQDNSYVCEYDDISPIRECCYIIYPIKIETNRQMKLKNEIYNLKSNRKTERIYEKSYFVTSLKERSKFLK